MIRGDRPTFTIVAPASAEERRLIPVATVRALTGLTTDDVADETLELLIDAALAQCATYCKLARAGAAPVTLAQEAVRATWPDAATYDVTWLRTWPVGGRGSQLILPWRAPISTIAVTEGETELEQDVDFRLNGAGVVERLSGGVCCGWSTGAVVVDYTAGWIALPEDPSADPESEPMPADLVARIAEQIKLEVYRRDDDPGLRSEDVPGIWSGTYSVPGGDSIGESGLLRTLEAALGPYRAPASFA